LIVLGSSRNGMHCTDHKKPTLNPEVTAGYNILGPKLDPPPVPHFRPSALALMLRYTEVSDLPSGRGGGGMM
jgi:hypothetical protein